ncbi:MAG: GNAT family N-acetyltransferase [Hungatella sp.]
MTEERRTMVDGTSYTVVISDEREALLAADAAGRAMIGVLNPGIEGQDLTPAVYLVEQTESIDAEYLERVQRRKLGLPWIIGETERLWIREFRMEDIPLVMQEEDDSAADRRFYLPEKLEEYIRCQYGFYQYGIWALVDKASGNIVGKAGISNLDVEGFANHEVTSEEGKADLQLGYHIFPPYRRVGYAREACTEILNYAKVHLSSHLYAKIDTSNEASIQLAEELGFHFMEQRYSEAMLYYSLYAWNC